MTTTNVARDDILTRAAEEDDAFEPTGVVVRERRPRGANGRHVGNESVGGLSENTTYLHSGRHVRYNGVALTNEGVTIPTQPFPVNAETAIYEGFKAAFNWHRTDGPFQFIVDVAGKLAGSVDVDKFYREDTVLTARSMMALRYEPNDNTVLQTVQNYGALDNPRNIPDVGGRYRGAPWAMYSIALKPFVVSNTDDAYLYIRERARRKGKIIPSLDDIIAEGVRGKLWDALVKYTADRIKSATQATPERTIWSKRQAVMSSINTLEVRAYVNRVIDRY